MNSVKVRDSNYELLRIISMIFIVLTHVILHGHVIDNTTGDIRLFFDAVLMFIIVHVNCFMLITGYYQSKSKFKLSKLLKFILQLWFYNFIIILVLSILGIEKVSYDELFISGSFFEVSPYWYFRCFLIVFMLSPFFNDYINRIDRVKLKKFIVILLICFSILPYFTGGLFYVTDGFNIEQQIMMYFIGAYIRKYNINDTFLNNFNISKKRFILISLFIFNWIISLLILYFTQYLGTIDNNLCRYLYKISLQHRYSYNSPFIIIQSISLFILFGTFNFKSKVINFLSSLTLGIYLIHENKYLKLHIYKWLGIDIGRLIVGNSIIYKVFFATLIIYVLSSIIEFLRIKLFKLLFRTRIVRNGFNYMESFIRNIVEVK